MTELDNRKVIQYGLIKYIINIGMNTTNHNGNSNKRYKRALYLEMYVSNTVVLSYDPTK